MIASLFSKTRPINYALVLIMLFSCFFLYQIQVPNEAFTTGDLFSKIIVFLLLFLPSVLLVGADGLVFAGILMLVFILKSKERKPFHWFILAQFVSISFSIAQLVYQFSL